MLDAADVSAVCEAIKRPFVSIIASALDLGDHIFSILPKIPHHLLTFFSFNWVYITK